MNRKWISSLFYAFSLAIFVLLLLPILRLTIPIWWLDNLLNLQIQWAFIALLLILINFFWIKKAALLSALILMSMVVYNLLPLYFAPWLATSAPSSTAESYHFTVAQLNLSYDNPNITQLLPRLIEQKIALLVMQEVSDKEINKLQALTQYYPYSLGIGPLESTPSGLAIFSKYPISEKNIHDLGAKNGYFLEIILQLPNSVEPIQVFAIHPTSPRTKTQWQIRNLTLLAIADKVVNSPFANKLVIGDFNSSPWSGAFRRFQGLTQLKNSALAFGYIPSWSYYKWPLLALLSSAYIDHSLVSNSFTVSNKHAQKIQGSDHLMLLTELAI